MCSFYDTKELVLLHVNAPTISTPMLWLYNRFLFHPVSLQPHTTAGSGCLIKPPARQALCGNLVCYPREQRLRNVAEIRFPRF